MQNIEARILAPFDPSVLEAWENNQVFSGWITISLVLKSTALSLLDTMYLMPEAILQHLKNLLLNEICCDTEIIVGDEPNQKVVKCHQTILVAGSEVFQKMFESGLRETRSHQIEMKGISEIAVRALLAYLYYRDTSSLHENCEIAFEVLQAANKYIIKNLRDFVQTLIETREYSWFRVNMILELFVFAKALCPKEEEIEDIKEDAAMQNDVDEKNNEEKDKDMANSFFQNDIGNSLKIKSLQVLKW